MIIFQNVALFYFWNPLVSFLALFVFFSMKTHHHVTMIHVLVSYCHLTNTVFHSGFETTVLYIRKMGTPEPTLLPSVVSGKMMAKMLSSCGPTEEGAGRNPEQSLGELPIKAHILVIW